jgi:hypothetical protein
MSGCFKPCKIANAATTPTGVTACDGTTAHCIPEASLPSTFSSTLKGDLGKCPDDPAAPGTIYCTPDDYIKTQGVFTVKTCRSLLDAEGRCTSTCMPQVNVQLTALPQTGCGPDELCAPCYNPIDGTDTHACTAGCGDSIKEASKTFQKCGGANKDQGVCVPQKLVTDPVQLKSLKAVDDPTGCSVGCASGTTSACSGSDSDGPYLCAPLAKARDQSYQFPVCTPSSLAALLAQPNSKGQRGGCVPVYLVPSAKQALTTPGPGAPPNDGCQAGEVCGPCTDPTAGNAATGACPP